MTVAIVGSFLGTTVEGNGLLCVYWNELMPSKMVVTAFSETYKRMTIVTSI